MAEGRRGELNPKRFAQSLARQLSARYEGYAEAVLQRIGAEISIRQRAREVRGRMIGAQIDTFIVNARDEEVYNRVVHEPLERLRDDRPGLRVYILVDALDEALTYGHPNIVTLLAGSGDLPDGVRFLLTNRNEPRVRDQFRRFQERQCLRGEIPGRFQALQVFTACRAVIQMCLEPVGLLIGQFAEQQSGELFLCVCACHG